MDMLAAWIPHNEANQMQPGVFGIGPLDIDEAIAAASRHADEEPGLRNRGKAKCIITELYRQGVFNLRNAVQIVGEQTGISPVTVYWHLRGLKNQDRASSAGDARGRKQGGDNS